MLVRNCTVSNDEADVESHLPFMSRGAKCLAIMRGPKVLTAKVSYNPCKETSEANQCFESVNISFGSGSVKPSHYGSGRIRILIGHFCHHCKKYVVKNVLNYAVNL